MDGRPAAEVRSMKRTVITVLGLIAVLASAIAAQSNNYQNQTAVNVTSASEGDGSTRPRLVEVKSAEVKASVIVNTASAERIAFGLINQKRAENGLKPLAWSDDIEAFARRHSQDMADNKYFGHRGLDGSMVSDRADRTGVTKWRAIGENIAFNRGYKEPIEVAVELWMQSPGHRQNLLNPDWRESAVGVAIAGDGSYYFTQVFLKR